MGTLTAPFYPSAALRDRVQAHEAPAGRRRRYARRARRAGVVIRIVGPGGHPPRQTGRGAHHRPRRRRSHHRLRTGSGHRQATAVHRNRHRLARGRAGLGGDQRTRGGSRPPSAAMGDARAEEDRQRPGVYPALSVGTRDVNIGDPVHILGFPGVVLSHELLNQSVTLEASVTNGAISGFKQDAIGQDVLQSDAPAAHGNSGGPAIRDDASLVGVMTFVSLSPSGGAIVQGFNFLIPARDVLKFLADTPVKKTGESPFNVVWDAGLTAFFRDRDELAVQKIQEANRLVPNLADVKRTLAEAEERVKNPRPRPFPWAWTTFGVSMLSVGTYGGMWGRRWWRNRFRVLPAQVIGFIENELSPLLVDVRTKTDYETSPLKLPGAVRLDPDDAEKGRIPLDAESNQLLITYCTSPEEATSARFAHLLHQRKFSNVRILKGGLGGWTNARLPVEAKSHLPSIGLEIYKNLTLGDVERRRYKAGETIFREGEDAHAEAYVVHTGSVDIRKQVDGGERQLSTLGEGELLGEMALFRKAPRSASALASTDVELLVIKNERLEWLIRNRPQLTIEILKRLSEWVVSTDHERSQRN